MRWYVKCNCKVELNEKIKRKESSNPKAEMQRVDSIGRAERTGTTEAAEGAAGPGVGAHADLRLLFGPYPECCGRPTQLLCAPIAWPSGGFAAKGLDLLGQSGELAVPWAQPGGCVPKPGSLPPRGTLRGHPHAPQGRAESETPSGMTAWPGVSPSLPCTPLSYWVLLGTFL